MLNQDLTEKQTQIWHNLSNQLITTTNIKLQALKYYLEYRQHVNNNQTLQKEQFCESIFRLAYFISEKSQITYNVKGEKVQGIALSLNNILKKMDSYEDLIYNLKEMLKHITIQDKNVEESINYFVKRFSFVMTFQNKFHSTFKKIKFKETVKQDDIHLYQSMIWLIFVHTRALHLKVNMDIVENTCLLACIFTDFILQKQQDIQSISFDNHVYSANTKFKQEIFQQFFKIKDMATYKRIEQCLKNYLSFIHKQIIKNEGIFLNKYISQGYKKIDSYYQKRLDDNSLDQRMLLKERINNNLHQTKFTPFGGRRNANKLRNQKSTYSHKILTYQLNQNKIQDTHLSELKQNKQNELNKEIQQINFLKNIKKNKTPQSILIKATPMTLAMELYNWLYEKSVKFELPDFGNSLINLITKQVQDKNSVQLRKRLIYGLWKDVLNTYQNANQVQKLAYLAICAQVTFYILNYHNSDLQSIIGELGISYFNFWQKVDNFMNFDKRMPNTIKSYILTIETSIITKKLWSDSMEFLQLFDSSKGKVLRDQNPNLERLHKRILHHIAYQIYFLCQQLKIDEQSSTSVFIIVQHALVASSQLIYNRNLDQLILCSLYAYSKAKSLQIKFNDIILCFKQMHNLGKQFYYELIENIQLDGEKGDIIAFYNTVFIKNIKKFLIQIKYKSEKIQQISTKNHYFGSPVKNFLPKQLTNTSFTSTLFDTPNMQALYAYNQSPLLKQKQKKNLNRIIGQGLNIININKDGNKQNNVQQTIDLINKKFKKSPLPPDMKFVNYRNMNK